jgi:hypothetical protein
MKARIVKKFEDEIRGLEHELKTQLPQEIKRARELGDLRENAEYQAAKERQTLLQSRIGMLKKRVAEISLMNLDKLPRDKAAFGSIVHVRENGDQERVYRDARGRGWGQGADLDEFSDRTRHCGQDGGSRDPGAHAGGRAALRDPQAPDRPRRGVNGVR